MLKKKIEILKNHHSSDSQTAWRIPSASGTGPTEPKPKKIRKISTFFQLVVKILFEVPVCLTMYVNTKINLIRAFGADIIGAEILKIF